MSYLLDTRLAESSVWVADLPLSELRLKNHQHYPWCILIPRVSDICELYELNAEQQMMLMQEIKQVSIVMKTLFAPMKLNVASLGNVVSQLHVHIVARQKSDPLWPQGIWQQALVEEPYRDVDLEAFIRQLRTGLAQ